LQFKAVYASSWWWHRLDTAAAMKTHELSVVQKWHCNSPCFSVRSYHSVISWLYTLGFRASLIQRSTDPSNLFSNNRRMRPEVGSPLYINGLRRLQRTAHIARYVQRRLYLQWAKIGQNKWHQRNFCAWLDRIHLGRRQSKTPITCSLNIAVKYSCSCW